VRFLSHLRLFHFFILSYYSRHGHVVIGGKGANGKGLSDVWVRIRFVISCLFPHLPHQEFDYVSQFWSNINISPGGPSARWAASGGSDPRTPFSPLQGLNNSFYLAGGNDGTAAYPLSDVWRLNISGALSSNLPNNYIFGRYVNLVANAAADLLYIYKLGAC
jgi:hypothetical protein